MTDLYDREPVPTKNELLIQLDARFLDDRFPFDGIGLDNRSVGIRPWLAKARAQLGKGSEISRVFLRSTRRVLKAFDDGGGCF